MYYATRPIQEIPDSVCKGIRGIFFDIDDTFTYHGKIYAEAFDALWEAAKQGLHLVPLTGRPAGWADHIARMWPVDGVIAENGAVYFCFDPKLKRLIRHYAVQDSTQRRHDQERLHGIFQTITHTYPTVTLASDQPYRETDLAVDFCEDVSPPLSLEDAKWIKQYFESHGASAKISSIHVNAWFGRFDKLAMCKRFMHEQKGLDLDVHKEAFFFCGDSPNDVPLFHYFPHSSGVAGIAQFNDPSLMDAFPPYVATQEGSFGFAKIVKTILEKRKEC